MTTDTVASRAALATTASVAALMMVLLADVSPVLAWTSAAAVVAWCSARWAGVPASGLEAPALVVAASIGATGAWASVPVAAAMPYLAWLVIAVAMARAATVPAARRWTIALLVAGASTIGAYSALIRATTVETVRVIVYPAVRHWGHYPEIGTLCALTLPLALGAGLAARSRRGAAGAAALGLLLCTGLALSSARASWVAAVIGCLVAVSPSRRRGGVAVGLLVVAGLLLVSQTVVRHQVSRLDAAASSRGVAWVRASTLWRVHPWVGWGPGQYRAAYAEVYGTDRRPAAETAHNLPLQVAVEMGLAGVLALSWLALRVARAVHARMASATGPGDLTASEAGVIVALAVRLMADVFDPTSHGLRVFVLSAVLVGLAARAPLDGSAGSRAAK